VHHQDKYGDSTNRVVSIGLSWTRKVLSSVRVYGEQRDLAFFLYEKHMAHKFSMLRCGRSVWVSLATS
jgi:hypothetical protein